MIPVIDPASAIGALRIARGWIDDGTDRYICLALVDVMQYHPGLLNACCLLRDYIDKRCRPLSYMNADLEFLLTDALGIEPPLKVSFSVFRMCRLAWIDRMIHELETNGGLP